jgi:aerobic carbon-monoxide dehydrogenase medium subunit
MKPAPFRYLAPRTLAETLQLLAQHGDDAKPLAGGQSLVPAMNFRLARPAVLVDLNRVGELAYLARRDGALSIGAMTRQRTAERAAEVLAEAPLLAEALRYVAHPQIRNRGTIGGSLAHADPAAELPAVALALDATVELRSERGSRRLRASDFYTGLFATALAPGELLTEVTIPSPALRSGFAFEELSRRHGDYALVGVATAITLDAGGRVERARIALLSVGEGPWLAERAAGLLRGSLPGEEVARAAADSAAADVDPPSDIHASAAFRRHLVAVLTRRALLRAFARARAAAPA